MNIRLFSTIGLAVLALAFGGCATMSSEECAATDWSAIGYEDGSRGFTMDRFSSHRQACTKHGITPDFRAYKAGRDEGLVDFCQPSRGYNLGVSGGHYAGVCDAALEEEFLDAYRVGNELYKLRSNVNSANARIYAKERELEDVKDSIRAREAQLIADDTTAQNRILAIADLKELSERIGELEAQIEELIRDRVQYENELADYEQTVAAYSY